MHITAVAHLATIILIVELTLGTRNVSSVQSEEEYEYPPFDGWYNNRANPDWGAVDSPLLRRLPSAYKDGVYEPSGSQRPNAMDITLKTFSNSATGLGSYLNRTALLVFFGQQVVEEILDAQRPGCPPEYFNLEIPEGHIHYDPERPNSEMPFLRTRYDTTTGFSPNNPRQQLNEVTPWIDGGLIYGPNKAWSDALRTFEDGLLAATNDTDTDAGYFPAYNQINLPMANPPPPRDHHLKSVTRFFKLGNPRGNENPFLLTFGVLWFRYHNFKARQLKVNNGNWSDEKLFNEARKWVIATHQKIVLYDWLAAWLGEKTPLYKSYDPNVHPGIVHVFQSAAMRFGHTLVPPGVWRRNATCHFRPTTKATGSAGFSALRTCNTYFNAQEAVQETDIDELLMGMASQISEREDMIITPDLMGNVFGPLEFSRRDLMAINIQRARDHGLPDYNTARIEYGLPRVKHVRDINPDLYDQHPEAFDGLLDIYNNSLNDLDIWPSGLLETTPKGPGPLFKTVIKDQFLRIRDADRFWFENYKINKLFTEDEIDEIRNISLKDIVLATTKILDHAIQDNPFFWHSGDPCPQPYQLSHLDGTMENCTERKSFDYFTGSHISFVASLIVLPLALFVSLCVLVYFVKAHVREVERNRSLMGTGRDKKAKNNNNKNEDEVVTALEWIGEREGMRKVKVKFDVGRKFILVKSANDTLLRVIDFSHLSIKANQNVDIYLSVDKNMCLMSIRVPKEYDLVLKFSETRERDVCMTTVTGYLGYLGVGWNPPRSLTENVILKQSQTKAVRQKMLESFLKAAFTSVDGDSQQETQEIYNCELTQHEFAELLGMKPKSLFVETMFKLFDKDQSGYLSLDEFKEIIFTFYEGDTETKYKVLFDMYDLTGNNKVRREDFKVMLRSVVELGGESIEDGKIETLVNSMFVDAGMASRQEITFEEFKQVLRDYKKEMSSLSLDIKSKHKPKLRRKGQSAFNRKQTILKQAYGSRGGIHKNRMSRHVTDMKTVDEIHPTGVIAQKWNEFVKFVENYKLHIFWITLYTLVTVFIFIERAYYYSVEKEHTGLRMIAGYGVTVTRGAASAMMFTYSTLLLTMCRNSITVLRETFLHRYIPFDTAVAMHKYIASLALIFTLTHIVGHAINFYHISTQTADDLTCLFRNYFHASHELPKFHRWLWCTLTGFTGVLLAVLVFVMYVFAVQYARRHAFRAFWITHHLYSILFVLMIMHGAGRLVQRPLLHYFLIGPLIVFTMDKLVTLSRKKVEIAVVKAELLPSDVTYLEIQRPLNFEYKSGQWVRIASAVQSKNEYHPFTLTSAPHEENLGLHIRAVGPWTMNLRRAYDPNVVQQYSLPKVFIDGPYGEGHQDWYRFDVSVLVGGGIGVTPFASILKDLGFKSQTNAKFVCKKVYFVWVCRSQRQFEWMTDIIRDVEEKDKRDLVSVHIFITQFKQKFDIRTTMLYMCERHFERVSGRSLLTGLRSVTHFGRPDFKSFLQQLPGLHSGVTVFGVFSCGPPLMTGSVETACYDINKCFDDILFVHHYENF